MNDAAIDKIARRYKSGMISYEWALHLVVQEIDSQDAWTPIVVLSEHVQRLFDTDERRV